MRDTSHERLYNVQKGLLSDHDKYLYHDGWLHDTNRLHMQPWVVKEMMYMFIYIIRLCMHTFSLSLLCLLIIISFEFIHCCMSKVQGMCLCIAYA